MSEDCLFCRIAAGGIPADKVYEDDRVVAFRDINPQAPVHCLVIPRKHIPGPAGVGEEDEALAGHLIRVADEVARSEGISDYRLVFNNGAGAGQTVFHIHLHVLGGRGMQWPPG